MEKLAQVIELLKALAAPKGNVRMSVELLNETVCYVQFYQAELRIVERGNIDIIIAVLTERLNDKLATHPL